MDPFEDRIRYLLSLRGQSPQADAYSRRELFKLAGKAGRYAAGGTFLAALLAACGSSSSSSSSSAGGSSSSSSSSSASSSGTSSSGSGSGSGSGTTTGSPASGGASPVASGALPEMTAADVPSKLKGSGKVVAVSYGGAYQDAQHKAYFEPFQKLCGIEVVEAEGPDIAKIKAMVDTKNVQWDLPELGLGDVISLSKTGDYFEKIDYSLVDVDNIEQAYRHEYAIAMNPYGLVYGYRTDAGFPRKPSGWADFWDTKTFPGPRSMEGGTGGLLPFLEAAEMAAGTAMDKVYPINIDAAYNSMSKIKKSVVQWWSAGAQPVQMLANKDAVMAQLWSGRILTLMKQTPNAPLNIAWSQGQLAFDVWGIPKGAPNKENAQKLAAFSTLPISQARLSMLYPNGFVNKKSADYIPQDILSTLVTAPEHRKEIFILDDQWWADNRQKVLEKWNTWILS